MADKKRIRKRNNYTLSNEAQAKVDSVPKKNKSAYVSSAIEHFTPTATDGVFHEKSK